MQPEDYNDFDDSERLSGREDAHEDGDDSAAAANHREQSEAIAKRETRIVTGLRFVVLTVLVTSTILLAWTVHSYLSNAEQDKFHGEFESDATKVLRSIGITLDQTLGAVDAMEVSIVSHAKATNQSYPFVTIPDFAVRAAKMRRLARAAQMAIYHVVRREERAKWEAYTATHNSWVNESIKLQDADPDYNGPILYDHYYTDDIYGGWGEPMPEADLYLPTWQAAPVIPKWAPYNWDAFTMPEEKLQSYKSVLKNKKVILAEAWNFPPEDETNEALMQDYLSGLDWIKDFADPHQDPAEPIMDVFYPLLNAVDAISIENPSEEEIVGQIVMNVCTWTR